MPEKITYISKEKLNYTIEKMKEYISTNCASKTELDNIATILDNVNGEVV